MATRLTLQGEITPEGDLRVDLPDDLPRGRCVITLEPVAGDMTGATSAPEPESKVQEIEGFRREFRNLLDRRGIRGKPISHQELRELSLRSELEPNELSRDLIAARESRTR